MKFTRFLIGTLLAIFGCLPACVFAQTMQDNTPGTFLLFPKFDIRGDTATQIRIVNNGPSNIKAHLIVVCPGVKNVDQFCAELDTTITFTRHQTRVIDISDLHPPCTQGYVTALAWGAGGQNDIGGIAGNNRALSYNHLTGSYRITAGRELEAENALASQSTAAQGTFIANNARPGLGLLPPGARLYTDFKSVIPAVGASPASGSRLTLVDLNVSPGTQNPVAAIFVDFWNTAEVPYSTSLEFVCWTDIQLDLISANFLRANLGTTRGSMELVPASICPIPGACPNFIPRAGTILGSLTEYGDGEVAAHSLYYDLRNIARP